MNIVSFISIRMQGENESAANGAAQGQDAGSAQKHESGQAAPNSQEGLSRPKKPLMQKAYVWTEEGAAARAHIKVRDEVPEIKPLPRKLRIVLYTLFALLIIMLGSHTFCSFKPREFASVIGIQNCPGSPNCLTCKSALDALFVRNGARLDAILLGHTERCNGGFDSGTCLPSTPEFCNNGQIENRSDICGCPKNNREYGSGCALVTYCKDLTLSMECSKEKPFRCIDGSLVKRAKECGCPSGYRADGNDCELIVYCPDGTASGECSKRTKPMFCAAGKLVPRADLCSCEQKSYIRQIDMECVDLRKPDPKKLAAKIHERVNYERRLNGLPELEYDLKLEEIGRLHSIDMHTRKFAEHLNPDGLDPAARAAKKGYACTKTVNGAKISGIAENIFVGKNYNDTVVDSRGVEIDREWKDLDEIASDAVYGWMTSPGQRKNVLSSGAEKEGIGIYVDANGNIYATQMFC